MKRKILTLALSMAMLLGVTAPVHAQEDSGTDNTYSPVYDGGGDRGGEIVVDVKGNGTITFYGSAAPDMADERNVPKKEQFPYTDSISVYWWNTSTSVMYLWQGGTSWAIYNPDSGSSSKHKPTTRDDLLEIQRELERIEAERAEQASRGAVRLEAEADSEGFENAAQMQSARAAGKSAGEYYNNAVTDTPGIENATPVAQGGSLIVDGKTTNMTASISKVTAAYVDSVSAVTDKKILNVVDVQFPVAEVTINFYMPGVAEGTVVTAMQYKNGTWTEVEVAEVRADHVILNLDGSGVVAFME